MIDYFTLALSHGLIILAVIRLLSREDLDADPAEDETAGGPAQTGGRR